MHVRQRVARVYLRQLTLVPCTENLQYANIIRERSTVMSVSVCVSDREHILRNYMSDLHQNFPLVTYSRGSVLLWLRCNYVHCTSDFVNDVIFAHNGAYRRVSIPLQRVTSLRRRAQANASAASHRLRRVQSTAAAETKRVHHVRCTGDRACNAPLTCVTCLLCCVSMVTASFPLVSAETTPTDVITAPYDADGIPAAGNLRNHHVTSYRTLPHLRVMTSQSDTPTSCGLLRQLNHVAVR